MTAAIGKTERQTDFQTPPLTVTDLVLLRIAASSATRADLQRDVAPLLAPKTSGTEFRRSAEFAIGTLSDAHLVSEAKGRLTASAKGRQVAEATLGAERTFGATWAEIKSALLLRAFDLR
jgi:hypothetical protein